MLSTKKIVCTGITKNDQIVTLSVHDQKSSSFLLIRAFVTCSGVCDMVQYTKGLLPATDLEVAVVKAQINE